VLGEKGLKFKFKFCYFIPGFFNVSVGSSDCVALDETMSNGFRIGNDIEGAVVDEFKKYPDTFLEKLKKSTKLRITGLRAEI
jgi:hypothetical protein